MQNKEDFMNVGVYCARICFVIQRGTRGKTEENLSPLFVKAMEELTRFVVIVRPRVSLPRFIYAPTAL
jgi:hypothetical protein